MRLPVRLAHVHELLVSPTDYERDRPILIDPPDRLIFAQAPGLEASQLHGERKVVLTCNRKDRERDVDLAVRDGNSRREVCIRPMTRVDLRGRAVRSTTYGSLNKQDSHCRGLTS